MVVYFSGTGNSRCCAQLLASLLRDESLDAFHYIREGIAADLVSGTPWVFVAPTYGWRLPRIFEQFLRAGSFQGSEQAYFLLTCGSEMGDAGRYNRQLCADLGMRCRGSLQIVMPENYIALFSAPGPEEAQEIVDAARPDIERAAEYILRGEAFPELRVRFSDRFKSAVINPAFYRLVIRAKAFTVSDQCVSCGHCAAGCPTGNITLKQGRPVWADRCTHCMACICGCPVSAIEYGKASVGKPRYQCPGFSEGQG